VALSEALEPQRDHVLGGGAGAVTLVMYGDYECPFTRIAYRSMQRIVADMGERFAFAYRHFPLREKHPHAQGSAEAAEEAGAQDRFWQMHDLLFSRQHALQPRALIGYARELGLDVERLGQALADGRHRSRVERDTASGMRSGVTGTPTMFIQGTLYAGSYAVGEVERALQARL
jgi:protein-disulfide isomerase